MWSGVDPNQKKVDRSRDVTAPDSHTGPQPKHSNIQLQFSKILPPPLAPNTTQKFQFKFNLFCKIQSYTYKYNHTGPNQNIPTFDSSFQKSYIDSKGWVLFHLENLLCFRVQILRRANLAVGRSSVWQKVS